MALRLAVFFSKFILPMIRGLIDDLIGIRLNSRHYALAYEITIKVQIFLLLSIALKKIKDIIKSILLLYH